MLGVDLELARLELCSRQRDSNIRGANVQLGSIFLSASYFEASLCACFPKVVLKNDASESSPRLGPGAASLVAEVDERQTSKGGEEEARKEVSNKILSLTRIS